MLLNKHSDYIKMAKIKELLKIYYRGFAQKKGWESVISDDFIFTGGDMTITTPIIGKDAYIEVIKRFSKIYQNMRIKEMIVEGEKACVIGNYDYKFPNGVAISGNVAEIWTEKNGKLNTLTIFFDTLNFDKNTLRTASVLPGQSQ